MDDAEITEDIHVAIETMESHQEIREVRFCAVSVLEFLPCGSRQSVPPSLMLCHAVPQPL